jgi:hypothetical protein
MKNVLVEVTAWGLVVLAAGLGIYACILFNSISPALAHGIIGFFR